MSDTILEVHPLAPLLLRDGRPFAGGNEESRAQSLPVPLPHTLAGFVRTQLGGRQGWNWQDDAALKRHLEDLHGVPVRFVLVRDGEFMFPAPQNAVVIETTPQEVKANKGRPQYELLMAKPPQDEDVKDTGSDIPDGLSPLLLFEQGAQKPHEGEDTKPLKGFDFWPKTVIERWLLGEYAAPFVPTEKHEARADELTPISGPPTDERTHVAMDSARGVGKEGMLYTVSYRSFGEREKTYTGHFDIPHYLHHRWNIRVKTDVKEAMDTLGHLGGERRPVALTDLGSKRQWPNLGEFEAVKNKLLDPEQKRICFILTTPALFGHGWKPSWLKLGAQKAALGNGSGLPAGIHHLLTGNPQLRGVAVGRKVAVSGWNLRTNKPKAVRWAVPAGSVYFLEVTEAFDRENWLDAWMKPLSDELSDRRDGFGCALWGVW